jgi:hypothetical protein
MMIRNFNFTGLTGALVLVFLLAGVPGMQAQDITWSYSDGTPITTGGEPSGAAGTEGMPRQFRSLYLGMSLEELKSALTKDSYFNFRGDSDVSLLPARDQSLVETTGSLFIRRAFFQFRDGELFIMALVMDTNQIDYYSMFTNFVSKYGEPAYLDPKETVWENEDTRISIERPLTVKYIDKLIFNDIIDESAVNESGRVQLRHDFINEF